MAATKTKSSDAKPNNKQVGSEFHAEQTQYRTSIPSTARSIADSINFDYIHKQVFKRKQGHVTATHTYVVAKVALWANVFFLV